MQSDFISLRGGSHLNFAVPNGTRRRGCIAKGSHSLRILWATSRAEAHFGLVIFRKKKNIEIQYLFFDPLSYHFCLDTLFLRHRNTIENDHRYRILLWRFLAPELWF